MIKISWTTNWIIIETLHLLLWNKNFKKLISQRVNKILIYFVNFRYYFWLSQQEMIRLLFPERYLYHLEFFNHAGCLNCISRYLGRSNKILTDIGSWTTILVINPFVGNKLRFLNCHAKISLAWIYVIHFFIFIYI